MTELNLESLLEIASANKTAENIFEMFSSRQRMRFETDLTRFRINLITEKGNLNDKDFYDTFKKLSDLGVCDIVAGKKGLPTRVKWRYNLLDVANSVTGMAKVNRPLQPIVKDKEERKKAPLTRRPQKVVRVNHDYVGILKKGDVSIEVHFKTLEELAEWSKKIA